MADRELPFKFTADTSDAQSGVKLMKSEVREAARVVERSKTDWEKYGDELERITELEKRGALATEQASRAREAAARRQRSRTGAPPAAIEAQDMTADVHASRSAALQRLAGAAGFGRAGGLVAGAASGPLGMAIAGLTVGIAGLTAAVRQMQGVQDLTQRTDLSPEFILATQRTAGRLNVTDEATAAYLRGVDRFALESGRTPAQAERQLLSMLQGMDARTQRLAAEDIFGTDDASLRRLINAGPIERGRGGGASGGVRGLNMFDRVMSGLQEPVTDAFNQSAVGNFTGFGAFSFGLNQAANGAASARAWAFGGSTPAVVPSMPATY